MIVRHGFTGYNLSGALIEETYPSGRKVKNTLDADGSLAQVQSQKNASDIFRQYANSFVYTAAGAVGSMKLGNGKFENTVFNSRLHPTQIGLGSSASTQDKLKLNYDYGTAQNNGNVLSQIITVPTVGSNPGFTATQNYSYDSLNRMAQATETIPNQTGWNQTFAYDRYGNRNFVEAPTTTLLKQCNSNTEVCVADRPKVNPSVDVSKNQLIGYAFDNAGNTAADADGQTFTYDAENKQVQVNNATGIIGQYFYDGDVKRVKKYVPSTGEMTIFVYDAAGKLVAEYSTIVEPQTTAKISYLTNDHLGSPRITTDAIGQVVSRRDFRPFGEEISRPNYGNDSVRQKFTGYERDKETELDFAQARYHDYGLGRFSSPDPLMASARRSNPQTFNRYVYVLNNPVNLIDPLGMIDCPPGTNCAEPCKPGARGCFRNDDYSQVIATVTIAAPALTEIVTVAAGILGDISTQPLLSFATAATLPLATVGSILALPSTVNPTNCPVNVCPAGTGPAIETGEETSAPTTSAPTIPTTKTDEMPPQLEGPGMFRGGPSLMPGPNDNKIRDGLVQTTKGVSVNIDPTQVVQFGGAYRVGPLPAGLMFIQRGKDPRHYEIVPTSPIPLSNYVEMLMRVSLTPYRP